jgi:hypothetical protein
VVDSFYSVVDVITIKTKSRNRKKLSLTKKMMRSPDERHTQTHGSLIEMF